MRVLLLAGTGEARRIGQALAAEPGIVATASLAGETNVPGEIGLPLRVGGFGGRAGFAGYLRDAAVDAVLDATHPFASRMSHRSFEICHKMSVPYGQFLRPPWRAGAKDLWTEIPDEDAVPGLIEPGATVFLATGPKRLDRYAGIRARRIYCRRIDPPTAPFPFANGEYLVGRPPFSVADEIALFEKLGIDWLVTKNAGGTGSRAKIDAARALGLRVAMIARPAQPPGVKFETVDAALAWVRGLS